MGENMCRPRAHAADVEVAGAGVVAGVGMSTVSFLGLNIPVVFAADRDFDALVDSVGVGVAAVAAVAAVAVVAVAVAAAVVAVAETVPADTRCAGRFAGLCNVPISPRMAVEMWIRLDQVESDSLMCANHELDISQVANLHE